MFRNVFIQPDQIPSYRSQVNLENLIHLPHKLPFDQRSDKLSLLLEIPFIPVTQTLFIHTRCHWIPHQIWIIGPDLRQLSQSRINCGTTNLEQSKPGWQETSWSMQQEGRYFILIHLRNPDRIPSVYFEPPTIKQKVSSIPTSLKFIGFCLVLLGFQYALWRSKDQLSVLYIVTIISKWLFAENVMLVIFDLGDLALWQKLNMVSTSGFVLLLSRSSLRLQVLSLFLASLFGSFLFFIESQIFFKHFHTWQALSLALFIPVLIVLPISDMMNFRQGARLGFAIALIIVEELIIPGQHILVLWPFAVGLVVYDLEQSVRKRATELSSLV